MPTAYAAPPLSREIVYDEPMVWPDPRGLAYGEAIDPLYERAIELPSRCPSVYEMLMLIDAVRVGRARERKLATDELRRRLSRGKSIPLEMEDNRNQDEFGFSLDEIVAEQGAAEQGDYMTAPEYFDALRAEAAARQAR